MDHPLTPEEQNALIEEALQTYPVAAVPRDLTPDVMRRIRATPAPRPFGPVWNDLALGLVLALCVGAIGFSLQNLPPLVAAQIRKESLLLYQHILVNARWLIPALSFCLAGFLSALTLPYLRQQLTSNSV